MPIQWFLSYFDNHWSKLSDFGRDGQSYRQLHKAKVGGKEIKVISLAHPRQIAKLRQSCAVWYDVHEKWLKLSASEVAQYIKVGEQAVAADAARKVFLGLTAPLWVSSQA